MAEEVLRKKDEISLLRHRLWVLRAHGHSPAAIMKALGITKTTYYRHLRALRVEHRQGIESYDAQEDLGATLRLYTHIEQEALRQYDKAGQESARVAFLKLALEARQTATKLKIDLGLLQAVPLKVQVEAKVEAAHAIEVDEQTARAIAEVLLRRDAIHRAAVGPDETG